MRVVLNASILVFHLVQPGSTASAKCYPFLSKYKSKEKENKAEHILSLPQFIMSRVLNVFFENHSFMYVRLIMESVRSFFSNFQVLWKPKWSSQKYNQVRNRRMSMTSVHLVKTLWQLIYSKTDGSCYFHIASFHLTRIKKNKTTKKEQI